MDTRRAPRATMLTRDLSVLPLGTLKQLQALGQAALAFVAKTEDEALAAHMADDNAGSGKSFVEAAAVRAGLEQLIDIVNCELTLKRIFADQHSRQVFCLGEPVTVVGANPVAVAIAARGVEMSPVNTAHAVMFPRERQL